MSRWFWFWFNFFAGLANMVLALTVAHPKWFTIVCIGLSLFVAGYLLNQDDRK